MMRNTVRKTVSISNGKHDTCTVVHGTWGGGRRLETLIIT